MYYRVSIKLSDKFELSDTIHFHIKKKKISQCLEFTQMIITHSLIILVLKTMNWSFDIKLDNVR